MNEKTITTLPGDILKIIIRITGDESEEIKNAIKTLIDYVYKDE